MNMIAFQIQILFTFRRVKQVTVGVQIKGLFVNTKKGFRIWRYLKQRKQMYNILNIYYPRSCTIARPLFKCKQI